jgi:hypothetical protein
MVFPTKISLGHLLERDTCLSRPQAKRVGGAPAIMFLSDIRALLRFMSALSAYVYR